MIPPSKQSESPSRCYGKYHRFQRQCMKNCMNRMCTLAYLLNVLYSLTTKTKRCVNVQTDICTHTVRSCYFHLSVSSSVRFTNAHILTYAILLIRTPTPSVSSFRLHSREARWSALNQTHTHTHTSDARIPFNLH